VMMLVKMNHIRTKKEHTIGAPANVVLLCDGEWVKGHFICYSYLIR
jgi:hypothetical protein